MSVAGDTVAQGFRFLGFLPSKGAARQTLLREVAGQSCSLVLFEAPHRIEALARDLVEVLPAGRLTLCRELTKQFEEIATLPVADFPAWLTAEPHRQRGEFVIVVHAQPEAAAETLLTARPGRAACRPWCSTSLSNKRRACWPTSPACRAKPCTSRPWPTEPQPMPMTPTTDGHHAYNAPI